MGLSSTAALWFAPFLLPICFLVAWNDLARMKIPNVLVMAMAAVYAVVGLIALPFDAYLWGYAHLGLVLLVGIGLNALGAVGAGDAKFAAAAAPFIHLADLRLLLMVFLASLLGAYATHRIAKHTKIRTLVPEWKSWTTGARFPMGLALGAALSIYMILGIFMGA